MTSVLQIILYLHKTLEAVQVYIDKFFIGQKNNEIAASDIRKTFLEIKTAA